MEGGEVLWDIGQEVDVGWGDGVGGLGLSEVMSEGGRQGGEVAPADGVGW